MPNWCENRTQITAPDEQTAREFFEATRAGDSWRGVENVICSHRGKPATGGDANMAEWTDEYRAIEGRMWISGSKLEMSWGSRWEPPIPFYDALVAAGMQVYALYLEPGMSFCGSYDTSGQHHFEYRVREDVPAAIEAEWGAKFFDWIFEDEA